MTTQALSKQKSRYISSPEPVEYDPDWHGTQLVKPAIDTRIPVEKGHKTQSEHLHTST